LKPAYSQDSDSHSKRALFRNLVKQRHDARNRIEELYELEHDLTKQIAVYAKELRELGVVLTADDYESQQNGTPGETK